MIVKDEEKDIERCLKSVYKHIDYWVIIDTGSTDKTVKKINSLMKNRFKVPGELHERPWVNFSHNRNESLEIAETKGDYVMFMDADDIFVPEKSFAMDFLSDKYQAYYSFFKLDSTRFKRCLIVDSSMGFRYKGVMHEYIDIPKESNQAIIPNMFIEANASPLKRFPTEKEKYLNDAKIIEEDLLKDPENTRSWFYLGQCYGDANEHEKSMEAYMKRSSMGGFREEVYLSLYRIAAIMIELKKPKIEVIEALSKAWEYMPYRKEAPSAIMSALIKDGRNFLAFTYGDMTVKSIQVFGESKELFEMEQATNDMFPKYYGIAAEKCGFYPIAIASYKVLLKNNPDTVKSKELQKKIKELEEKCSV